MGSMYVFMILTGVSSCSTVIPFVATQRTVVYRERFAGMYYSWAYSLSQVWNYLKSISCHSKRSTSDAYLSWHKTLFFSLQVIIEIPYIFFEAVLYSTITYPAVNYHWSAYKVFWYLYTMFTTLLYYKYLGMMLISVAPTSQVAATLASFSYTLLSLFSGYLIPEPVSQPYFSISNLALLACRKYPNGGFGPTGFLHLRGLWKGSLLHNMQM